MSCPFTVLKTFVFNKYTSIYIYNASIMWEVIFVINLHASVLSYFVIIRKSYYPCVWIFYPFLISYFQPFVVTFVHLNSVFIISLEIFSLSYINLFCRHKFIYNLVISCFVIIFMTLWKYWRVAYVSSTYEKFIVFPFRK